MRGLRQEGRKLEPVLLDDATVTEVRESLGGLQQRAPTEEVLPSASTVVDIREELGKVCLGEPGRHGRAGEFARPWRRG